MARSIRMLLAAAALAITVTALNSRHGSEARYGYKPYSYSYGIHQPYRQQTNVYNYQHGSDYAHPYGYGGYPYGYGSPYGYGDHYGHGNHHGYGYGQPAHSHVMYSGYPADYAFNVAHPKVHPHKYADHKHMYAYKPGQFGYSSTVVHPIGAAVLYPAVTYRKPAVMHEKAEEKPGEEADAMADGESASGDEMEAEEVQVNER